MGVKSSLLSLRSELLFSGWWVRVRWLFGAAGRGAGRGFELVVGAKKRGCQGREQGAVLTR